MVEKDAKVVEDLCKYERIPFLEFGEKEYEYFVSKCMFNEEYSKILFMLIHGCQIVEIAYKMNLSDRTVARRIRTIKRKIKKVL